MKSKCSFSNLLFAVILLFCFVNAASAYYDCSQGRFISRDPVGTNMPPVKIGAIEVGASGPVKTDSIALSQPEGRLFLRDQPSPSHFTDGPNLYQYVRSNPAIYVDPYGLSAEKCDKCGPESVPPALEMDFLMCEDV